MLETALIEPKVRHPAAALAGIAKIHANAAATVLFMTVSIAVA